MGSSVGSTSPSLGPVIVGEVVDESCKDSMMVGALEILLVLVNVNCGGDLIIMELLIVDSH